MIHTVAYLTLLKCKSGECAAIVPQVSPICPIINKVKFQSPSTIWSPDSSLTQFSTPLLFFIVSSVLTLADTVDAPPDSLVSLCCFSVLILQLLGAIPSNGWPLRPSLKDCLCMPGTSPLASQASWRIVESPGKIMLRARFCLNSHPFLPHLPYSFLGSFWEHFLNASLIRESRQPILSHWPQTHSHLLLRSLPLYLLSLNLELSSQREMWHAALTLCRSPLKHHCLQRKLLFVCFSPSPSLFYFST